jgi:hypothetical protein
MVMLTDVQDERFCPERGVPRAACGCWNCRALRGEKIGETIERRKRRRPLARHRDCTIDPTFIYFIQAGSSDGPIKIGYADEPFKRMDALQTAHWVALTMLHWQLGSPDDEKALLERFRPFQIRGEWFSPAPPLLEHIAFLRASKHGVAA